LKSTILKLTTGFEIEITPLPPYSLDALQQKYRSVEFKRGVVVASGVTEYIVYDPPDKVPDRNEMPEEYNLYNQYLSHQAKEREKYELYTRERTAFLLAKCVKVVSGPTQFEDEDWREMLAAFGLELPANPIRQKVLWLQQVVFGGTVEYISVLSKYAIIDNLTMDDVKAAMNAMQATYDDEPMMDVIRRLPSSLFNFDMRMTEAEALFASGIRPDQWYEMEIPARAEVVVGYLAPKWRETIEIISNRGKS
jgi:hypothetical protein